MSETHSEGDKAGTERKARTLVPRCHIPWQQMVIDSTGAAVPCCYWGAYDNNNPPVGNINEQSIDEIWNGPGYQKLRTGMAKGDLKAAGCGNCYAVKQGMGLAFEHDPACDQEPAGEASKYKCNMDTLRQEIAVGATVMAAKPTIVSFTPSHRCNIRCTHCYQESTRTEEIGRARAQDEVVALAPYLVRLVAGGGEPFLLPIWNKFLNEFDLKDNPYLDFATSTNATIVSDKIIDGLKRFKKLTINVSLDGTGAAYDRVRVGAKFDRVVENIRTLRQVVGGAESTESALGVSMCVMKSNILDLPNFVRFCSAEGLAFGLSPVTTLPPDESLRCFNNRAEETKGWAESIDEAERLIQEHYLPAMVARRNESVVQQVERDFWKQNIQLLREAANIDGITEQLFRVTAEIPEFLAAAYRPIPPSEQVIFVFRASEPASAPYWAPLINGKISVSLPAGEYALSLGTKWAPGGYWDILRLRVDTNSDQVTIRAIGSVPTPQFSTGSSEPVALRPVRLVRLPQAVASQLPFLMDARMPAHAILYAWGKPEQSWLTKSLVTDLTVSFAVPRGKYCLSFSPTHVSPGYWDVVQFEVLPDSGPEIQATYHPITAHRVVDSAKRRLRKLLAS
jgi:radical SAM protein with 4Fe4S-binding SPASM domain